MRLIDADLLKEDLSKFYEGIVTARELIDSQPTVEQPKKGRWRSNFYISKDKELKVCTCCHYECQGWDGETGVAYDYCPNCGAEMQNGNTNREYKDGEQDDH